MPLWRNRLARCTYRHERDAEVVSSSLTRGTDFAAPKDKLLFLLAMAIITSLKPPLIVKWISFNLNTILKARV